MRVLFILFLCIALVSAYGQYVVNDPESYIHEDFANQSFDFEDINNDGNLDVVFGLNGVSAGVNVNQLWAGWNTINNLFSNRTEYTTNSIGHIRRLKFGKLRNSQDKDLVVVYENRTEVLWNENNGLILKQNNLPGSTLMALGKVNLDDAEDLVLLDGNSINVYINNNGQFTQNAIQTIAEYSQSLQLVDVNKSDERMDLVTLVQTPGRGTILNVRKNVSGQFAAPSSINLGSNVIRAKMGDVNNDEYPDLVVLKDNGYLQIYLNQDGQIPSSPTYQVTGNLFDYFIQDLAICDMDNDGWNDLVIARIEGWFGIWINQKTGSLFTASPQQTHDAFIPYSAVNQLGLVDIQNTGGLSVVFNTPALGWSEDGAIYAFRHIGDPAPAPPRNVTLIGQEGDHPHLTWKINKERDLNHYEVWRYRQAYDYQFVKIADNITGESFVDNDVVITLPSTQTPVYAVRYKIKAVDNAGNVSDYSNEVSTCQAGNSIKKITGNKPEQESLPKTPRLLGNYPNPFNPVTKIRFTLPEAGQIRLSVYDMSGRKIVDLLNGFVEKGNHEVEWNARDISGRPVSSGIYLYELQAGDIRLIKKMMLLK